jgi:hypothetical protein
MSAKIELPEFMTANVVERTYRRMIELQDAGGTAYGRKGAIRQATSFWDRKRAQHLRAIGTRMAVQRDPKMLLFLERASVYLQARSDEQLLRVEHLGFARINEYQEAALFRTALEKADSPGTDREALHAVWGWVYAAVAEALGMG